MQIVSPPLFIKVLGLLGNDHQPKWSPLPEYILRGKLFVCHASSRYGLASFIV